MSILTLFILVGAGATVKKTCVAADSEEYYGTWINPDYNGTRKLGKLILRPDGTWASYLNDSDTDPSFYGSYTVTERWTDSEGNIWIKMETLVALHTLTFYELSKLSNSGKTLELVSESSDYPTEMDANHPKYRIRYRK
jgi:hypothetical protein